MASRARRLGRGAVKGLGGSVLGIGLGAIGYAVHGLSSKLTAPDGDMKKYPSRFWIPGVALAVAGHVMRSRPKLHDAGCALSGAAGFSIAEGATLAYTIKQNETAQSASTSSTGTSGLAPGLYSDSGAVFAPNEGVGALMSPSELVDGSRHDAEINALMNV